MSEDREADLMVCSQCKTALVFAGTREFHGVFGNIGEVFVNRGQFDIYVCPRCVRVEFFIDGIGEEFRPH